MRSVILYILLVALPALAVVGILEVGQSLRAPASVAGSWQIHPQISSPATADCGDPFTQTKDPTLAIVQSGPHLQLALNDANRTLLEGTIAESQITVASLAGNRSPHISLQADLNSQAEPDVLQGTFTFRDCTSQPAVPFTAIRQPAGTP